MTTQTHRGSAHKSDADSAAEGLAAARAEFWSRWRKGPPPAKACPLRGPKAVAHITRPALPIQPARSVTPRALSEPRRHDAESLRTWFERCIAKELHRCEQCMTAAQWREHREWIETHARGSLWDAVQRRAARGELRIRGAKCAIPTT
jgi:hypothetical protein